MKSLVATQFSGYSPISTTKKKGTKWNKFDFNPNTFCQEYKIATGKPLALRKEFDSSIIYNANNHRNFWQKLFVLPIKIYHLCTRFNKIPFIGPLLHKLISEGCVFKESRGGLSCSEFGVVAIDQLGQTGLRGVLKALAAINKRTRTCFKAGLKDSFYEEVSKKIYQEPIYYYSLKGN